MPNSDDPQLDVQRSGLRLQKVLADAGVASRRAAEGMIAEGRVTVDGALVTAQGTRVDPERAVVRVDGRRIPTAPGKEYYALNKPAGVVTAMRGTRGERCVGDLVGEDAVRLFHVGRLDVQTEGLLILTNDGPLAHRLAHPSFGVPKTYLAEVSGPLRRDLGRRLRDGVVLADGPVAVDSFRVIDQQGKRAQLELTVHVGRNRIVRRLLAELGHPVHRLVRLAFGPIQLAGQRSGSLRRLTAEETGELLDIVALPTNQ